jgi:esterase/lipase
MTSESILLFIQMMLPLVKSKFHLQSSILVLAGTNDNLFKVKEIEKTARKYNADFKIIEGVAHNMMLDCKYNVVASEVINWLGK